MNLFDRLVAQAMGNRPEAAPLRVVVEKELLHHDILREMSRARFLEELTFIGGTCLRACYGSPRLSEDLDFTGGEQFTGEALSKLGATLVNRLESKYGLHVQVTDPKRERGRVSTWKLRIVTRPAKRHLPSQRINIDICALPSHDRKPVMLRNHYGVDMGTSSLVLQAQSRQEIMADKFVALALRPNRLKNRDLWDIVWLHQQGIDLPVELLRRKLHDRHLAPSDFLEKLEARTKLLESDPSLQKDFAAEMKRFLPPAVAKQGVLEAAYWTFLVQLIAEGLEKLHRSDL